MCEKSLHVLCSNMFIASTFWQAWQADMDGSNMILAFSMSARANAFNVLWLGDCLEIFPCPAWCLTGIFDDLKVPIKKKKHTYNYLCHPMPLYIYIWMQVKMYRPIRTLNPQAYPYPRSIHIHTKTKVIQTDPYFRITAGRSIPEFWRNLIYNYN